MKTHQNNNNSKSLSGNQTDHALSVMLPTDICRNWLWYFEISLSLISTWLSSFWYSFAYLFCYLFRDMAFQCSKGDYIAHKTGTLSLGWLYHLGSLGLPCNRKTNSTWLKQWIFSSHKNLRMVFGHWTTVHTGHILSWEQGHRQKPSGCPVSLGEFLDGGRGEENPNRGWQPSWVEVTETELSRDQTRPGILYVSISQKYSNFAIHQASNRVLRKVLLQ